MHFGIVKDVIYYYNIKKETLYNILLKNSVIDSINRWGYELFGSY